MSDLYAHGRDAIDEPASGGRLPECPEHGTRYFSECPTCVEIVERPGGARDQVRGGRLPADRIRERIGVMRSYMSDRLEVADEALAALSVLEGQLADAEKGGLLALSMTRQRIEELEGQLADTREALRELWEHQNHRLVPFSVGEQVREALLAAPALRRTNVAPVSTT